MNLGDLYVAKNDAQRAWHWFDLWSRTGQRFAERAAMQLACDEGEGTHLLDRARRNAARYVRCVERAAAALERAADSAQVLVLPNAPMLRVRYRRHSLFGVAFYRDDPGVGVELPDPPNLSYWAIVWSDIAYQRWHRGEPC